MTRDTAPIPARRRGLGGTRTDAGPGSPRLPYEIDESADSQQPGPPPPGTPGDTGTGKAPVQQPAGRPDDAKTARDAPRTDKNAGRERP